MVSMSVAQRREIKPRYETKTIQLLNMTSKPNLEHKPCCRDLYKLSRGWQQHVIVVVVVAAIANADAVVVVVAEDSLSRRSFTPIISFN